MWTISCCFYGVFVTFSFVGVFVTFSFVCQFLIVYIALIQEGIYDEFVRLATERAKKRTV